MKIGDVLLTSLKISKLFQAWIQKRGVADATGAASLFALYDLRLIVDQLLCRDEKVLN